MGNVSMSIQEIQTICSKMLKDIVRVCEDNHIHYYAMYGTLLGTIRHHGPIPWDYDVDIYIPEYDINRFIHLVETNLSEYYWVDFRGPNSFPKTFPRIGIKGYETTVLHIDVFRMSGLHNNKLRRKIMERKAETLRVLRRIKDPTIINRRDKSLLGKTLKIITLPIPVNYLISKIDGLCRKYEPFSTDYVGWMFHNGEIYKAEYFKTSELKPYKDFFIRVPGKYDELLRDIYGDYMCFPPKEYCDQMMSKEYTIKKL